MYTQKLFKNDVYLKKTTAIITSVTDFNSATLLTFNQTVFFPEGGGQDSDTGKVTIQKGQSDINYEITDVYEREGKIYHKISAEVTDFSVGDEVEISIDWNHRFDNMQRHCGEHILSGAFFRLYGGANKGFHMGSDYITVDIAFDEGSPYSKITWDMAKAAERAANQVIWSDEPITVDYFKTRSEAEKMPLRKHLAFDEDISVVTIGDISDPADCVACCGTHPSTAGQVGLIKIYKIEPNKGMSRIFFEAGSRAFAHYQKQYDVLYDLGVRLSAGFDDIVEKYDTQVAKNQVVHDKLHSMTRQIIDIRTRELQSAAETAAAQGPSRLGPFEYSDLDADDIIHVGNKASEASTMLITIVDLNSLTLFLFSSGPVDCGKLVKQYAADCGGKGGGSPAMARCKFPDHESLNDFITKINESE